MIQFKRDTADNIADHSTYVLGDGQPFYNKTDKLLYIGDGTTQLGNLEPLAGLNYLTMKDIWLSEYSSPTSDVEFSTSLFNRQPVAGDVALYFWKYSQQANVYAVTATVTSADDTSTYVEVSDYYSITGPAGPTGLTYNNICTETTGAPSDGLLINLQVGDFSRSPNVGESCAIYYQYQDDVWLCMVTIQNNNTEYCEAQIHEFTKVNGVDGADGKGILKSIKPQQLPNTWSEKTWNGYTSPSGNYIWTDGENIYYSLGINQYVLNRETSTWTSKTWNGHTSLGGDSIWTDGENIYYSSSSNHYVLNKETSTWTSKTWNGLTIIYGTDIWTDGENIYYSRGANQYVLNRETSTWSEKTWNGLTSFNGSYIWTDGENIYYSRNGGHYVLNRETSTWTSKTWNGYTNFNGNYIWTDGENIYYSNGSSHYVLNKATSTWSTKTWNGYTGLYGSSMWTDGENIYYSSSGKQYVLNKEISTKPVLGSTYDDVGQKLEDYEQDQFIKFGFMRALDNNIAQLYNKSTGSPEYSRNYICFNGYGGEIEIYWDSDSHQRFKGPVVVIDVTPWGTNIVDYTGNTTILGKGTDSGNILFAQTGASRWLIFRNNS